MIFRLQLNLLIGLFIPMLGFTQVSVKDSLIRFPMLNVSYAVQFPGGDIANRFGVNSNVGASLLYKTKNNWVWGGGGFFLFGSDVREDTILSMITTSDGAIINENGLFADVLLFQRGLQFSGYFGRIFNVFGPNPNSGILLLSGVGLLQHKIRIQLNGADVPQLSKEYKKGYDKLTNGLVLSQFIGYQYHGNTKLINFFIGAELNYAFTQSRRSYDFNLGGRDTKQRLDILNGIRMGWTLPLYKKTPQEFYFY
jgi:hypothetical protein